MEKIIIPEVLVLTNNQDSFTSAMDIPTEKIKLIDPKKYSAIKSFVDQQSPKLAIIDGCLDFEKFIVKNIVGIAAVRKRKKLNLIICVVHQDPVNIRGAIWETNLLLNKYLERSVA